MLTDQEVLTKICKEHNKVYRCSNEEKAKVRTFKIQSQCGEPFYDRVIEKKGKYFLCSGILSTWYVRNDNLGVKYRLEQYKYDTNDLDLAYEVEIHQTHW